MKATLYTDGGSRGNPGPAGIGFVLRIDKREPIMHGEYIGKATNNQAEYEALIKGLERAEKEDVKDLACYLDSQLLVEQMKGNYRVRDAKLKPLWLKSSELAEKFKAVSFMHVKRERNKEADALVNQALDKKTAQ